MLFTFAPALTEFIAGPPCSGKTTLAYDLAGPRDVVVDFDEVARDLGSPVEYVHPEPFRSQAEAVVREYLDRLPGSGPGVAYVIRSAAAAQKRAIAAKSIKAGLCIVLAPPADVCHARADEQGRPDGTHEQIDAWYAAYTSWSGDTLVDT